MVRRQAKRVFRRPHRRRWRSCTLCVFRSQCQVWRFIETVAPYIGIMECKYYRSEKLQRSHQRITITVSQETLFLFTGMGTKKIYQAKAPLLSEHPEWFYRDNHKKGRFIK
jgi:hypothetical protein